jgi:phenylalanyl-tRNA synthetase beta chain
MRSSLIGSLVGVLRHNLARKAARVRVFELGGCSAAMPACWTAR